MMYLGGTIEKRKSINRTTQLKEKVEARKGRNNSGKHRVSKDCDLGQGTEVDLVLFPFYPYIPPNAKIVRAQQFSKELYGNYLKYLALACNTSSNDFDETFVDA